MSTTTTGEPMYGHYCNDPDGIGCNCRNEQEPNPTTTGELEELAREWAADDRKWNTQDVVSINLIAFANAALAAKNQEWHGHVSKLIAEHKQQLEEVRQLRDQLAAAQAAIKAHRELACCDSYEMFDDSAAALDAAIAAAQQPLVDALKRIAFEDGLTNGERRRISADALAQVKDGKFSVNEPKGKQK